MRKYWRLIQALLVIVTLSGCANGCNNANANPLGSNPVINPTPVPTICTTACPTPTVTPTPTGHTYYVKVIGTNGVTSTIPSMQIWVIDGVGTTYLYGSSGGGAPATIDSVNSYVWSSIQSNSYNTGQATLYISMTTPNNTSVTVQVVNGNTGVPYSDTPGIPANNPFGGSFVF